MTLSLIQRAEAFLDSVAIADPQGTYRYRQLLQDSAQIAAALLQQANTADLQEQRIAFLLPSGYPYVAIQWGIWRAGGLAVPLCTTHPRPELEYAITHADSSMIIAHPEFEDLLRPIATLHDLPLILISDLLASSSATLELPEIDCDRRALMLFTSGTTGKPKGVVITHRNLEAQVTSLVTAWEWTDGDRILHVLPLHHIHGIVNVLTCALWSGATCYMLPKFDAQTVWQHLSSGEFTLFMAVPTIYSKLIAFWEAAASDLQTHYSEGCAALRLMVSGSAALPVPLLEKWQQISGHFLLERYGMTEIGMALSNPLHGSRCAGAVGQPLPQVEVRLVDDQGAIAPAETPGEIQVKGPAVFLEYWQNSEATAKAFRDGWFCTGDLAVLEQDRYRILGRISVDIIKTGGYKVSALEIEGTLLSHPEIQECAVVGVADEEWGERVCAAVVVRGDRPFAVGELRDWAKTQLANYKVPSRVITVTELPRNVMGKVTKPAIAQLFTTGL
ncbi:MAG: acyl-CoA synthetase [Oculatellaceae cyanobacterium Prado106]|nr:acyl-CoA synthetase [Oculatellaceae cyanobacterium Prado106]